MRLHEKFESDLSKFIQQEMHQDQAHDINHVLRVVKTAKVLSLHENANLEVVIPAAYLHDCFALPKNHPQRATSSTLAADKAIIFLTSIGYESRYFNAIHHAIRAHSFSANIKPESLEAQIVQDADRLDALGAIGIARCVQVSSSLGVKFYNSEDVFCKQRQADDSKYTIDHFYTKLLTLTDSMNTTSAKQEAKKRTQFMKQYLYQLQTEV